MTANPPLSIVHIATSLLSGGAEAVLYRLCTAPGQHVRHRVISLRGFDFYGPRLQASGVSVDALGMSRGRLSPSGLYRLRQLILKYRPDVIQTWMYHGDLVGALAARGLDIPIVWGLRNSNLEVGRTSLATRMVVRLLAGISHRMPRRIASCSQEAARIHTALGYPAKRFAIIPNGYDCSSFAVDAGLRQKVRAEFRIDPDAPVLGMAARWDPQKDHANLLAALAILARTVPAVRCLLFGHGMVGDNPELQALIQRFGLKDQIVLLGLRQDVPAVMNSLDLHVLSSAYGEAFPNVLAESMACGVPCVTTQVGDAALIVGDTGWVVPPGDAEALAEAIAQALRARQDVEAWQGRQFRCRDRIVREFSLERMVRSYHGLWRHVARRS